MKAVQIFEYSSNLGVSLVDIPTPIVTNTQILIKGEYAGVNPHTLLAITGKVKIFDHYVFPVTLGNEISGVVVSVGENVSNFKEGDRVYAMPPLDKMGTFAEYVAIDEQYVAKIPQKLSFEEAAAVPLSWLTTLQAFNVLSPKKGTKLFISGGTGGFGQIAVPYAVRHGLEVTISGASEDEQLAKQLGAKTFIDYKNPNYNRFKNYFDFVIDTRGVSALNQQFKLLKKSGHLVSLNAGPNKRFSERQQKQFSLKQKAIFKLSGIIFDGMATLQRKKYDFLYVEPGGKQLAIYSDYLMETAHKPVIDTVYNFNQINQAIERMQLGNNQGKIILKIGEEE
ncbi:MULTISPECIES: NADP-dependent oxidoreductase [Leuconostoc]|uniref:NADP-dependent oxidoreductase n=1 Tax=Leuconostoc TaxID=1243 RepID=UPI001362ECEF|nr:NADP-dependent oxidoreductase [Leuconostoc mesenteroides]QHM57317.1 Alcohol dehydrogenase [Leuconostoc mesenteroides]